MWYPGRDDRRRSNDTHLVLHLERSIMSDMLRSSPGITGRRIPMTPAPQQAPKEHCDHECVCPKYRNWDTYVYTSTPCPSPTGTFLTCDHDTRDSSHIMPVIKQKVQEIKDLARFVEQASKDHDATIRAEAARQAREDVLKSVLNIVEEYEYWHRLDLIEKIESLRTTQHPGQEG